MAVNKEGNGFTFGFAIALVVVVGISLATVSLGLKPFQQKNEADKKMMSILGAIKVDATRLNAAALFKKHVKEMYVLDANGEKIKGDAFDIDIKKQHRNKNITEADKVYPLYICDNDGEKFYVIPMVGKGLWGPIWGFAAIKSDKVTIYGATFNHKTETPGLGAEINSYKKFQKQFESKKIDQDLFVAKSGADQSSSYEVDGITGGTITSKGVQEMFNRTMEIYIKGISTL